MDTLDAENTIRHKGELWDLVGRSYVTRSPCHTQLGGPTQAQISTYMTPGPAGRRGGRPAWWQLCTLELVKWLEGMCPLSSQLWEGPCNAPACRTNLRPLCHWLVRCILWIKVRWGERKRKTPNNMSKWFCLNRECPPCFAVSLSLAQHPGQGQSLAADSSPWRSTLDCGCLHYRLGWKKVWFQIMTY